MPSTATPADDLFCPCGANCTECDHYPTPCGGCHAIRGKVWWTAYTGQAVCPVYACCVTEKGLSDCGGCPSFPCDHFRQGDPTKTDEENAAIYQKQVQRLSRPGGAGKGDAPCPS